MASHPLASNFKLPKTKREELRPKAVKKKVKAQKPPKPQSTIE
jgi:hypothetical protein